MSDGLPRCHFCEMPLDGERVTMVSDGLPRCHFCEMPLDGERVTIAFGGRRLSFDFDCFDQWRLTEEYRIEMDALRARLRTKLNPGE